MRQAPADHADVVVLPPVLHGGSILLAVAAKSVLGGAILPESAVRTGAGAALLAAGLVGEFLFIRPFRRTGQKPNPRRPTDVLVFDGPFRYTRNPAYVSLFLVQLGLGLLLDNAWIVGVLVPVMLVMHYGVVLREEAYLERKFGEEYRAYKRTVRRWI